MQLSGNLVLLAQLFVLAICQEPTPKDGLALYLESAMKEFPDWLKSTGGDPLPLNHTGTIKLSENTGCVELDGEIRDTVLNGHMEHYVSVSADFAGRSAGVRVNFYRNLEIVGNYNLSGSVFNKPVSGQGVFKLRNLRDSDFSLAWASVSGFKVTADGRIDLTGASVSTNVMLFGTSLPEIKGIQSGGYSMYIGRSIKSLIVSALKESLSVRLESYIRGVLEFAQLSTILQDNYKGNLDNRFNISSINSSNDVTSNDQRTKNQTFTEITDYDDYE